MKEWIYLSSSRYIKIIYFSLTYNPLTVSLSSVQLLNAERLSKRSNRYYRFISLWYDQTENQTQSTMLHRRTLNNVLLQSIQIISD